MSNVNIANACSVFITFPGAGPRSAVGSVSDSRARGPGFDTWSGLILSFLLPLRYKKGSCQLLARVCARSTAWLTA